MFSAMANLFQSRSQCLAVLHGHKGPIISLAISPNGKLLASGGADGIKVWDLKTARQIPIPPQPFNERSQVSCVCWVTRRNETANTPCYGNGLGFLVFLQHRASEGRFEALYSACLARGGEIICIVADISGSNTTRIATGTRDKCVQVWLFNSTTRELNAVQSKAYGDGKGIVPKALAFDANEERDLYVFGLYDGGLYKYRGKDARSISKHQLGSHIGNASVDINRRICVVDNISNGFDIYKLECRNFVKTHPKGVVFADNSHLVIGGSDHGLVYIFERKMGRVLKALKHARKGGVETIGVQDMDDGVVLIATALATEPSGPCPIMLWQWRQDSGRREIIGKEWLVWGVIEILFKTVVVFAAMAYLFGLIKQTIGSRAAVEAVLEEIWEEKS